ncbi:unnamed protein product [Thelazia callipaeda]|uniref:Piezo_RRas_bdg domain-containing protein n=1 Tax=Thelazia callipaeda TaxID=103827 RepID=A0A0N5DA25_THECL|nr:unnamed protein product [Thelazia callipaeda]
MDRRESLGLHLTGLVLLAYTALSNQSYFHFILFIVSLYLNAAFAFRQIFTLSRNSITLAIIYLVLHLFLLLIAQITYVQMHLNAATKSYNFFVLESWDYPTFFVHEVLTVNAKNIPGMYIQELSRKYVWRVYFCGQGVWQISLPSTEYTAEIENHSIGSQNSYLLTPVAIILWVLLFPSWLNFLWILASWFLFSLIGERKHRLLTAPFILIFASGLLITQYISGLANFQGSTFEKLGLHSASGSAAFYPLLIKKHPMYPYRFTFILDIWYTYFMILVIPFYLMRYLDGRYLEMPGNIPDEPISLVRRLSVTAVSLERTNRILYVCLYYMYVLLYDDWPSLSPDQWLSPVVWALTSALWLPFIFIFILIFVHIKRLDTCVGIVRKPNSLLSRALAASYDTVIAVSLCAFASYELSVTGIVLIMLSIVIFISKGRKCTIVCSAAALLLSLQWLISFMTYAFRLPNYSYPQNCTSSPKIIIDHNTAKWLGFSLNEMWTVVILLLIISMRTAFSSECSKWLVEVQRSDAEQDVASLVKFLFKNWMYKFGVEVCSVFGIVLACHHHDMFGLYFLVMVSLLRISTRRRQKLFWTFYANLSLIVLIIEYMSALGLPQQFSHCLDYPWNHWSPEVKKFLVIPFRMSSSPMIVADYIFLLLILVQKYVFDRESNYSEDNNIPLSEINFNQPIPAMYNDFISTKGNLLAYVHTAVFLYSHWVSMIIILLCSIEGASVLNFGYTVAVFLFMWKGTSLYACRSFKSVLMCWNCLVYYNIFLLVVKVLYLDASCGFGFTFPCWLERILGLRCVSNKCFSHHETTSLIYDMICFAVLTYQMRVFNSWYFQFVIIDYRADRILGTRGAELLLELKEREAQKNLRLVQSNVRWLQKMVEEEDKQTPSSVGPPPRSHEEIKRSGYYHQVSERFFPLPNTSVDFDREQRLYHVQQFEESLFENIDSATMVEKTVEVLDSIRVTAMHIFQLLNNPEWLYQISKGDAYVAHVLDSDKKRIKAILKDRLRVADTADKLQALHGELMLREDFQSVASSEVLWNEALNEYLSIHSAFKFLYCFSHAIMAQSELICFLFMLIVHLSKSSLITFPLPLMVFFWGVLAIPRPPKSFWVITAFYIQSIIVFRLLFCNELVFVPGEEEHAPNNNPFSIRRLLALDPSISGSYWDVALLAMVFLHRYKLLRLGMWLDDFQVQERHMGLHEEYEQEQSDENESSSCEMFCKALLMKKNQSTMDWYPWMVGCDALCLVLISFFYSMMGQGGSGNVLLDVQVSRLPRWFAYTLICVFVFMIIDRWLYLSKQIKFRFIYYICLVVLLHIVIFFFVPSITGRMVTWNGVAISLYLIKSAYLLMSAWHMRNGYPSVMNCDILSKGFGIFRLIILKIYLNIPFLFELRAAMDWTFTSTALTMGDFIRMENYYNEVEAQHCWIQFDHWIDNYFPTRKGRPTPTSGKFFKGVLSVTILIIIILAPILLFAFLNSFGTRAPPKRLHVVASIEGYPALYSTDTVFSDKASSHFSERNMHALIEELTSLEESDIKRSALSFISDYTSKDIFLINLTSDSLQNWVISLPGKEKLLKELQSSKSTRIVFEMSLMRPVGSTLRSHNFFLATLLTPMQSKIFFDLISANKTSAKLNFPVAQFLFAPPNGHLQPASAVNLALKRWNSVSTWQYHGEYWSVTWEQQIVIFVDRIMPSWMSIIVGSGGMVAMYVAVILVVGRFVREIVRTPVHNAMIENIPNCENLLRLFHDIYVVREKRLFYLESRLYGKLVFLMRSPETLIRWSRYRVKVKDE